MGRALAPEALLLLLVGGGLALRAYWRALRRRELGDARWRAAQRALPEGGFVVELVCPGEPSQEVQRIPAGTHSDELGDLLAEAVSEAEARAATLNAMRPR